MKINVYGLNQKYSCNSDYFYFVGASVMLEIVGGKSSFEEGSEVQLLCTISPYNNIMTWYVNNDNYADCFVGSCGASPNKSYTFKYNFDEASGKFRLTIDSVNSSHENILFTCDDGIERKDVTFDVTKGNVYSFLFSFVYCYSISLFSFVISLFFDSHYNTL